MRKLEIVWIAILLGGAAVSASSAEALEVPRGPAVTVDGRWEGQEWAAAAVPHDGGGEIALLATEGFLQIGIRSDPLFVASVCIQRGNEIHVFHASSALGHAVYRREGDDARWKLTQDFEWRLRKQDIEQDPRSSREEHRLRQGWVASTIEMDRPESPVEFQISSDYLTDVPLRVAVGLLKRGESAAIAGWPMEPGADDCVTRPLIAGPLPEDAMFDPLKWAEVSIAS